MGNSEDNGYVHEATANAYFQTDEMAWYLDYADIICTGKNNISILIVQFTFKPGNTFLLFKRRCFGPLEPSCVRAQHG